MVRAGFLLVFLGTVLSGSNAARGQDADGRLRTQLAVQAALQQGRDNVQRGNYQAAVYCLEKEIARVDGNREYINVLREAYRGYIRDLQQTNRAAEARTYQDRLKILDPGYQLEMNAPRSTGSPTIASLAAQTAPSTPPPKDTPKTPAAYTARPQMPEEQDPFAESNRAPATSISEVLDRAKRAYDSKDYATANKLYEEANRLDNHALKPYRELWAFCKLYLVTDAVNKAGWTPPAEVEKEVLAALALTSSPDLERQGKLILRAIGDRRIDVRHVAAQGRNWPEVETTNFRVIYNGSSELAEQVARVAENTRAAVIRKWFGEEAKPWERKCTIFLYPNAEYYARMTGKPKDSPGHSTLEAERENCEHVLKRQIDLHCDQADMLTHVLPHETTHATLLGRFGRHMLPCWADEGMANLSEPREKVERFLKNVPVYRSRHELFTTADLMRMKEYPEAKRITAFYVQSISLVEYLSGQKGGPQTFTQFMRDGLESGFEAALQKHYGFRDYQELEQRWSQAAADRAADSAAMYRPRR